MSNNEVSPTFAFFSREWFKAPIKTLAVLTAQLPRDQRPTVRARWPIPAPQNDEQSKLELKRLSEQIDATVVAELAANAHTRCTLALYRNEETAVSEKPDASMGYGGGRGKPVGALAAEEASVERLLAVFSAQLVRLTELFPEATAHAIDHGKQINETLLESLRDAEQRLKNAEDRADRLSSRHEKEINQRDTRIEKLEAELVTLHDSARRALDNQVDRDIKLMKARIGVEGFRRLVDESIGLGKEFMKLYGFGAIARRLPMAAPALLPPASAPPPPSSAGSIAGAGAVAGQNGHGIVVVEQPKPGALTQGEQSAAPPATSSASRFGALRLWAAKLRDTELQRFMVVMSELVDEARPKSDLLEIALGVVDEDHRQELAHAVFVSQAQGQANA